MTTPLFPFPSPPYYIVSPPFTEKSAGVKVLHMLCHALNVSGHRAYMVEMNIPPQGGETYCSDFIAPLLTPEADRYYASQRIDPIYVYPDIAYGNPFNAKRVVRWLLAPVSTAFPASDKIWAYSTGIALSAGTANILTCPAADPRQFVPLPGVKRRGTCFYAHKHRIAGGTLTADVSGSTEITRQMPRADMIRLLQHSERFYAYDDTFLIMEAILCGCPAVLLPSVHFPESFALKDFTSNGVAWRNDPDQIAAARATVAQARGDYLRVIDRFWQQLGHFIADTQGDAG